MVTKGQIIGKGGRTGNARGSHIHIETIYKGQFINPEYLFSFDQNQTVKRKTFWITKNWTTPYLHHSKRPSDFVYYNSKDEAKKAPNLRQKLYVVKKGDTLYEIARRHNVTVSQLCKINAIHKSSMLRIGQELML
jgi:murein DD-endopeptidase MepM/ murein hydrolase activator NlpD